MKKIIILCYCILALFALVACNEKKISTDIIIDIGGSDRFSKDEINNAIECVKNNFSVPGATLTKIYYDEEKSNYLVDAYLENGKGLTNEVNKEDVIVLLSNFHVNGNENNPVLKGNSIYEDYQWILIKDEGISEWSIDDCGF